MTETTRRDFMKMMTTAVAVIVMPIGSTQAEAEVKAAENLQLATVTLVEVGRGGWKSKHEACPPPDLHLDLSRMAGGHRTPFVNCSLETDFHLQRTLNGGAFPAQVESTLRFEGVITKELYDMGWEGHEVSVRYTLEDGSYYLGKFVISNISHIVDI